MFISREKADFIRERREFEKQIIEHKIGMTEEEAKIKVPSILKPIIETLKKLGFYENMKPITVEFKTSQFGIQGVFHEDGSFAYRDMDHNQPFGYSGIVDEYKRNLILCDKYFIVTPKRTTEVYDSNKYWGVYDYSGKKILATSFKEVEGNNDVIVARREKNGNSSCWYEEACLRPGLYKYRIYDLNGKRINHGNYWHASLSGNLIDATSGDPFKETTNIINTKTKAIVAKKKYGELSVYGNIIVFGWKKLILQKTPLGLKLIDLYGCRDENGEIIMEQEYSRDEMHQYAINRSK